MRIDTNSIGNYTTYMRPVQSRTAVSATTPAKIEPAKVTNEEKSYFANMYPESKAEIMDYHFYQKNGKMGGVSVGSLIDRRG